MSSPSKTLIVIAGPTAVGKTAIAIQLAKLLNTEIISADSRQCYQGMSIGTAQPTSEEIQQVKHHFIDAYPVTTQLTAADYETIALHILDNIFATNNTAIACGGTGLYIKALCEGLDEMPAIDEHIYRQVNEQYQHDGLGWLQSAIQQEDEVFYQKGEIQNPARMLRALIFKRSTGESITNYQSGRKKERPFNIVKIGLELPREDLYHRINTRVDVMMAQGLMEEVKQLFPQRHLKNLQTVGYTELFSYLEGNTTLETAIQQIKQNTRHYAKRQMTWFKKDKEIRWFRADEENIAETIFNQLNA